MENIVDWLLKGDVAIQFQTRRDFLDSSEKELIKLQKKISEQGWGKAFLDRRDSKTGLWGKGIYTPKWISTHYTLLDLKNIGLDPANSQYVESSKIILENLWYNKGKVRKERYQDVCVSAMVLSMCCYAKIESEKIGEIVDYLIDRQYPDGGWNCNWQKGDTHSSVHTTLSVLEGIRDYKNGYEYRIEELHQKVRDGHEFILSHNVYKSHRTGEVMNKRMLMLSYPTRWRYDILRCLDYFQSVNEKYDKRMDDAIDILVKKKRKNNKWPLQHKQPGLVHFDMESPGKDSRWNTLRALRVLKKYCCEYYDEITAYQ
jgi:hypothetical protein